MDHTCMCISGTELSSVILIQKLFQKLESDVKHVPKLANKIESYDGEKVWS